MANFSVIFVHSTMPPPPLGIQRWSTRFDCGTQHCVTAILFYMADRLGLVYFASCDWVALVTNQKRPLYRRTNSKA
jgi:hypothetical protein